MYIYIYIPHIHYICIHKYTINIQLVKISTRPVACPQWPGDCEHPKIRRWGLTRSYSEYIDIIRHLYTL